MNRMFSSLKPLYFFFTKNDELCIDKTKINPNAICAKEYNPVIGCDNKLYNNPCQAKIAGVLNWRQPNTQYDKQPNNKYNNAVYPKKPGCGCGK